MALLALLLGACGKGTAARLPTNTQITMKPVAIQVHLLDPGSAPRTALRLHLLQGATFNTTATINLSLRLTVAGNTSPRLSLPPTTFSIRTRVVSVTAQGSTLDQSITGVELAGQADPKVVAALRQAFKSIEGLHAQLTMDERGDILSVGIQAPKTSDPQVRQILDQFSQQDSNLLIPFPEEPVGRGARWTSSTGNGISLLGIHTISTATYVVQDMSRNTLNLQIMSDALVPEQQATITGLPAGAFGHVRKTVINSGGVVLIDLTQPIPTSFDQAGDGTVIVDVREGTRDERLIEEVTTDFKVSTYRV